MTSENIWCVVLLMVGATMSVAMADPPVTCPQPKNEPFCGNWLIREVDVVLPDKHMEKHHSFAIRKKHDKLVLFPRSPLKALWGVQKELEFIDADGDVPACLTTVVTPHKKPDMSADQSHVLRFLEHTPSVDPDTGEEFRRLIICIEDGDNNATDCICPFPHGKDGYHGGYSHAED
jgi:hypothetical protein